MRISLLTPAILALALAGAACGGTAPGSAGAGTSVGGGAPATQPPASDAGPASPVGGDGSTAGGASGAGAGGPDDPQALLTLLPTDMCGTTGQGVAYGGETFLEDASQDDRDRLAALGKTAADVAAASVTANNGDRVCAAAVLQIHGVDAAQLEDVYGRIGGAAPKEVTVGDRTIFQDGAPDEPAYHWFVYDTVFLVSASKDEDARAIIELLPAP